MDYKLRDEMLVTIGKRFEANKVNDYKTEMKNDLDVEGMDKKEIQIYMMALATYIGFASQEAERDITSTTIDEMRAHHSAIANLVIALKQALQEEEKRYWGHAKSV